MIKKISALIFVIVLTATVANAAVIFEDNFDDHSDWSPAQPTGGGSYSVQDGSASVKCTNCPDGEAIYAGFRVARTGFSGGRVGENTIQINSDHPRGGSGKSYMFWTEPVVPTYCEDWCNDGLLIVDLGANYDTIYVRYYIQFDSSWVWDDDAGSSMKMGHMQHRVPGGSYTNFFKDGDNWPITVPQFGYSEGYFNNQGMLLFNIRQQSCYYPNDGYTQTPGIVDDDYFRFGMSLTETNCTLGTNCLTWGNSMMDGDWHCVEYKLQGNSAKGVNDGELFVYIDGHLSTTQTNVAWADMGADETGLNICSDCSDGRPIDPPSDFVGWNAVLIGGNSNIKRYDPTSDTSVEQWYSIDDLVISDSYIGPDYVIGGDDTTPPTLDAINVQASGNTTQFDCSENMAVGSDGYTNFDTLVLSSGTITLSGCSITNDIIECNNSRIVGYDETFVSFAYTQPGDGLQDTATTPNNLASITSYTGSFTNNVPTPGASTVQAVSNTGTIQVVSNTGTVRTITN